VLCSRMAGRKAFILCLYEYCTSTELEYMYGTDRYLDGDCTTAFRNGRTERAVLKGTLTSPN
jgi:hypothetical protein